MRVRIGNARAFSPLSLPEDYIAECPSGGEKKLHISHVHKLN